MQDNPNYVLVNSEWVRRPDAPDAKHKSRVDFNRMDNLEQIRAAIAEARKKQNQINEEYRRSHNG